MTDEIRYSLASTLAIKCPFCGKSNQVKTSGQHRSGKFGPPAFDINTQVLPGCLHASIGQTRINNVLSTLNAPMLNPVTFKLREREVGKAVESVAKSSCQNCSTMEKNKAPQNGVKSDEGNLIPIPCSFEMGWQRRGKGYNSRTVKSAEPCQLSATNQSGTHQFSTYVLPEQDINYFASRVNKLKIFNINTTQRLLKDNKELSPVPLQEAVLKFLSFISQSPKAEHFSFEMQFLVGSQLEKQLQKALFCSGKSNFHV